MLLATTWADIGWAFLTAIVATAAWTGLAFAVQRRRLQHALDRFAGMYESHSKLAGEYLGDVDIRRDRDELHVEFTADGRGEITGRITLSERFPRSGRAAYEHRLPDGRVAWGTWDLQLAGSGNILVTTRYVDDVDPIEVVQGSEWRAVQNPERDRRRWG